MTHRRRFAHAPESVTAARKFAVMALDDAPAETRADVALMVSELASNCILHTESGFELAITVESQQIRVEVRDRGEGRPRKRSPALTDPTGRGLQIVDMLAREWGVDALPPDGKTVWFTIATRAPASTCGASA